MIIKRSIAYFGIGAIGLMSVLTLAMAAMKATETMGQTILVMVAAMLALAIVGGLAAKVMYDA